MNINQVLSLMKEIGEPFAKLHHMPLGVIKGPSEERSVLMARAKQQIEAIAKKNTVWLEYSGAKVVDSGKSFNCFPFPGYTDAKHEAKIFWVEEYQNKEVGQIYVLYVNLNYEKRLPSVRPRMVVIVKEVNSKPKIISTYRILSPGFIPPRRSGPPILALRYLELQFIGGYPFKQGFGEIEKKYIYLVPQTKDFQYVLQCFNHLSKVENYQLKNKLKKFKAVSLPESYQNLRNFIEREFKQPSATMLNKFDPGPSDFFYSMMTTDSTPAETKIMLLHIIKDLLNASDKDVQKQAKSFFQWGSATYGFEK